MENACVVFLCSFLYPWAVLLTPNPKETRLSFSGAELFPERNTSELSVPPFAEKNHPVLSPTHPSTDEQLHHMHVSLQDKMEKPAAEAAAATADLAFG